MKRNISIFSFLLIAGLLSSCSSSPALPEGTTDSAGHYAPTNAYRDTFSTTGSSTTEDNSGSGGSGLVKPLKPVAVADTTKK